MKVSVAMTTYNGERYVLEQLKSILWQTRQVDEVIICDDGSSDQTCQLVSDFIQEKCLDNWIFQRNKENLGFVANFIQTINKATGDVIFLCDQDDVWKPNKVSDMLKILNEHEEIIVLNTAVELIDSKNQILSLKNIDEGTNGNILLEHLQEAVLKKYDFVYLSKANISPGCTICFRSILKKELMDYATVVSEEKFPHDWAINLLGAAYFDGTYLWNRKLTRYRMHEDNTIGLDLEKQEQEAKEIKVKSTLELRIKNAEEMLRMKNICYRINQNAKREKKIDEMYFVAKKRLYFLKHLNLRNYFGLYRYYKTYKEMVNIRGIMSDALYAMRLDGIFRK